MTPRPETTTAIRTATTCPPVAKAAAPTSEHQNGDHLILIEDRKIATAYAIEAICVFDHLQFRNRMYEAEKAGRVAGVAAKPNPLTLRKPRALSGEPAWFERYYVDGSQAQRDRLLFSR